MRFLLLLFTIAFLSCESNAIDEAKLLGPDKELGMILISGSIKHIKTMIK
jgi:hypothetical protein